MRMVERKVRSRAQQLYESRGQSDGHELEDWFQAEAEILEDSRVAALYRHLRSREEDSQNRSQEVASVCEAGV